MHILLSSIRLLFVTLIYLISFLPGCRNLSRSRARHAILRARRKKQSGVQIRYKARVVRLLPDDTIGTQHQRFLVQIEEGYSLLISHNIDLAYRVPMLKVGDTVEFYGEYQYNERGGVIHWTHHDPKKWHVDGWIKHNGRKYG